MRVSVCGRERERERRRKGEVSSPAFPSPLLPVPRRLVVVAACPMREPLAGEDVAGERARTCGLIFLQSSAAERNGMPMCA